MIGKRENDDNDGNEKDKKKKNLGEQEISSSTRVENNFFSTSNLYYYHKNIGDNRAKEIIEEFSPELESLNLAHTNIGGNDVIDAIITYLIQQHGKIKELNLSGNHFTEAGISRLLDAVESKEECKLTKLCVTGNSPPISSKLLQRMKQLEKTERNPKETENANKAKQ